MKFIHLLLVAVFLYSFYVLYALWCREEYSNGQKTVQSIFIICLPLLGPIIIHGIIREFDRAPMARNPNDGIGHGEPPGSAG